MGNVASRLPNVADTDVENDSIVPTMSNVVQNNVQMNNVDLTSFNVVNTHTQHCFNVDLTLSDVVTPPKNNVETTLKCLRGCFPGKLVKFLRTTFFIEHLRWLLL